MDIPTLVTAISGLFAVIERAISLVDNLAQKRLVQGRQLAHIVTELKDAKTRLEAVRRVGALLPIYIDFYNGWHELTIYCNKIAEIIMNNKDILATDESSLNGIELVKHQFLWAQVAYNFRDITRIRASNVLVVKRRIAYMDVEDAKDIEHQVANCEQAFNKAEARLADKNVEDFLDNVQAMSRVASETCSIFDSSIGNMINALRLIEM